MVILAAGTYRSASTLQFNILRVIFEQAGEVYSCFADDYNPKNESPIHLIKIHKPNEELWLKSDYVFTSIRLKSEMVESIKRRRKYGDIIRPEEIDAYLSWFTWWACKANFIQSYYMIEDLPQLIRMYYCVLGKGDEDVEPIIRQLKKEMKEPDEGRDPKTLLHYGHRS